MVKKIGKEIKVKFLFPITSFFTKKGDGMKIGYARVSTVEQNLGLQADALLDAGCEKTFQDKISGATKERPALKDAINFMRAGDCLVVWRLDRLGRSLKDLIEIVESLEQNKVGFISLQEGFDTTTSGGKLIFHIFGALAEFERNLIRERTAAGLQAARARGKFGGRPEKLCDNKISILRKMYESKQHTIKEICETMGISKPTLYRYINK